MPVFISIMCFSHAIYFVTVFYSKRALAPQINKLPFKPSPLNLAAVSLVLMR